jgi:hypothetical protein
MYIYIYIYIYILRLRPCRRPLVNSQLLTGCLQEWVTFYTQNCNFGDPEAPLWVPGWPFWWSRGAQGHPMDTQWTPWGPDLHFIDFRMIWGPSWDPLWSQFCDLSVIWGAKLADGWQVHLFDDLGVEMLPESNGCMCLNHSKNCGFREVSLFQLIQ